MLRIYTCVANEHDLGLLLLATTVCLFGAGATIGFQARMTEAHRAHAGWVALIAVMAGTCIWTTHFVAMMAFRAGMPTSYAWPETFGSLALAIVGAFIALRLSTRRHAGTGRFRFIASGLAMGGAIAGMHYLGMQGYVIPGAIIWSPGYVVLSVAVGAALSSIALTIGAPPSNYKRQAAATLVLVGAILGAHLLGMSAVTILPGYALDIRRPILPNEAMIALSVGGSALIMTAGVAAFAFDTASRNRSAQALRDAIGAMDDGLAVFDADDRLVSWNSKYEQTIAGFGVDVEYGRRFDELIAAILAAGCLPEAEGRERDWLDRRLAEHRACGSSLRRFSDGRWIRVAERRIRGGGTLFIGADITELKSAETRLTEALHCSESYAQQIEFAENLAQLGHWRFDLRSGVLTWSRHMYAIYGLAEGQVPAMSNLKAMTHPEDRDRCWSKLAEGHQGGLDTIETVSRVIRPSGEIRHVSGKSSIERDEHGEICAVVGTLLDISAQKTLEEELREARAAAEGALATKGDFLATISHELRTPLTSIIGFANLAKGQEMSGVLRGYVDRIDQGSRALLALVNDILDFSKLEAGEVTLAPQPFSMVEMGQSALDLFAPQAGAKDLDLLLEAEGCDQHLFLDPDRVRQILLNLISNAVKFTDAGRVTLRAKRNTSGVLRIEVVDTGPGISKDKQDLLFRRFSQLSGAEPRTKGGTGLGLAICKSLVEAMGGTVGVESTLGVGSCFWAEISAPVALLSPTEIGQAPTCAANLDGLRVLVADDHHVNRELVHLFLAGSGVEVCEAEDGSIASQIANEQPFDLILMDINMPIMDGRAAFKQIRSGGPNRSTPILAFTAAGADERAQLAAFGFNDVVAKPVDPQNLLHAVGEATAFMFAPPSLDACRQCPRFADHDCLDRKAGVAQ